MTCAVGHRFRVMRSRLDPAVATRLTEVLEGVPVADRRALVATLARGKKVRGVLLCLVTESLGGDLAAALPKAVAVELVHAASLIHDDVVDRDTLRRGMPSVWAREGVHRAILLGDLLFSSAIATMVELGRQEGLIISQAIAEIARGACLEPVEPPQPEAPGGLRDDLPPPYETIIRLKTAILFEAACRLGALAAQADSAGAEGWGRYGLLIGEAYQIADDLHDIRACLERGAVDPRRAAPLVPALVGYANSDQRPTAEAVAAGRWEEALPLFRSVVPELERELERRLVAAEEAVNGSAPAAAEILCRVPREVIRIFDREGERPRPLSP